MRRIATGPDVGKAYSALGEARVESGADCHDSMNVFLAQRGRHAPSLTDRRIGVWKRDVFRCMDAALGVAQMVYDTDGSTRGADV